MNARAVVRASIVAGALLLTHACVTTPASPEQVAAFVGSWINVNTETGGLTLAEITLRGERIAVHLWGRCHPTDCDWGEATTASRDASDGTLRLYWNHGFAVRSQGLRILPEGRLEIVTRSTYSDARPSRSDREVFARE